MSSIVRAKTSSLLHCITPLNSAGLTLFSCCSRIDPPRELHLTQLHGLLGTYKQLSWMRKHWVTLGEAAAGWHVMRNAELSLCDNAKIRITWRHKTLDDCVIIFQKKKKIMLLMQGKSHSVWNNEGL